MKSYRSLTDICRIANCVILYLYIYLSFYHVGHIRQHESGLEDQLTFSQIFSGLKTITNIFDHLY